MNLPAHLALGIARESLTAYPSGPSFAAALVELEIRMRLLFLYGIDENAAWTKMHGGNGPLGEATCHVKQHII